VYDSKLSVKLGISQLRVKTGHFTLALSHPLITQSLTPSSSSSSVSSSIASSSTQSVPLAQSGMTVIYEDWYKVERAKPSEKDKPLTAEVHLRVEVIPGPMRTTLETSKSLDLSRIRLNLNCENLFESIWVDCIVMSTQTPTQMTIHVVLTIVRMNMTRRN
jgi:hypothetical protein